MTRGDRRGQSTAEYAVVLALVVGAVMAMQLYVKRGIQAKVKAGTDSLNAAAIPGVTSLEQYEPYYVDTNVQTTQRQHVEEHYNAGAVGRQGTIDTTRQGQEQQGGADRMSADDVWGR